MQQCEKELTFLLRHFESAHDIIDCTITILLYMNQDNENHTYSKIAFFLSSTTQFNMNSAYQVKMSMNYSNWISEIVIFKQNIKLMMLIINE